MFIGKIDYNIVRQSPQQVMYIKIALSLDDTTRLFLEEYDILT